MIKVAPFRRRLLDWYDREARALPWRTPPRSGMRPDPYRVWLSEVMLQQTTVPHAMPYFLEFTRRWPTVETLTAAEDAEVMSAWAGLGYYARARNLLKTARAVAADHGGVFPDTEDGLLRLPGVGPYTAAAVAAIAFDRPANVVDGNVERVVARLHAVETPLPGAKPELKHLAGGLVAADRPGDWAQALMDLGATICRPRAPLCDRCPVAVDCEAFRQGEPDRYPLRLRKAARPRRYGTVWVLRDGQGRIGLMRRPPQGLLGGMLGLPTSEWLDAPVEAEPPIAAAWRAVGEVEHVFTHFHLTLRVMTAEGLADSLIWDEDAAGLPSVFLKAVRLTRPER
ncbi:A/G-specific adenine glycosylase [Brevundimonas sp. 2R-24]|uniref:Adenine DNA glycosylase n=1 Tax=Peiella sedimenti TaxID=3061083 RepID=A0ABT8SP46_9CAUL|nr:A/G-specific adenine glycosylase [Caulobacteraceae bacterium XZ-24]